MCKHHVWPTQPVAQPPYHSTSGIASSPHSYQAVVQPALPNAAWDAFVTGLANSEHTQLSGWAILYRLQGYTVWRLVIYQGAVIVGGMQLAVRQHLRGVRGAYAEWGPLLKQDTPALAAYTVAAMQRVARALRLAYLVLLPPREHPCLVQQLIQYGYRPTWYGTAYTLTQQINVRQPEPVLLKQMRRTLRQSLRQGQRRGTTVRLGTAADLPLFYALHCSSSQRQMFTPLPLRFFETLWAALPNHVYLFIAEAQGRPLSAVLVLQHGTTARLMYAGWNREQPKQFPNEVLYWAVIQWSQQHGLHCCDLEWVDQLAAHAFLRGDLHAAAQLHPPSFFKLSLGGQVVAYPGGYGYLFVPVLGQLHRAIVPRLFDPVRVHYWLQQYARPYRRRLQLCWRQVQQRWAGLKRKATPNA